MKHLLTLLCSTLLLSACIISEPESEPKPDPLSPWITQVQVLFPDFTIDAMEEVFLHPIRWEPQGPVILGSPLTRSAEGNNEISSHSQDGKRILAITGLEEPDTSVFLSHEDDTYSRILSCGTPCTWTHAIWVSAHEAVIAGFEEAYDENGSACNSTDEYVAYCYAPVYYLFDLQQDTVTRFEGEAIQFEEYPF